MSPPRLCAPNTRISSARAATRQLKQRPSLPLRGRARLDICHKRAPAKERERSEEWNQDRMEYAIFPARTAAAGRRTASEVGPPLMIAHQIAGTKPVTYLGHVL